VRYSINHNYDLWALDLKTRKLSQLTTGPGPDVSPRISPDGKRIACLSIPRKGSHRDEFQLAVVELGKDGPRTKVVFDALAPSYPLPVNCWHDDLDTIFYHCDSGAESQRPNVKFGVGRQVPRPPKPPAGQKVRPRTTLNEIAWRFQQLERQNQLLALHNNHYLKQRLSANSRVVSWDNAEGMKIEGILTLPPPSVAKAPYKLLLHPHGGPHSRSALGFDFTVQLFAAHGYAVFQPNYRGSYGYGQKFIDADRFDFGGGDVRDILTGIDYLVKQGLVDRDRQFVYGTSYGGFLTCWLVGHTRRFRAAVAQNAVTDMTTMWGLSDIRNWVEWEVGNPWKSPGALRKHSPLTYADKVETPTLMLHSRDDRRVPLANGALFYQALRTRGVPTEMVIYPGEGHGIRQPRHREDVLRRVLAWFERYDKK
jgi:dipeptidyl aminopeptidase/acylaminoacyl peptidase